MPVQLFNTTINGVPTKVVGAGGKDGYYYELNAANGNLIYKVKVGLHYNEAASPTRQGVIVYPGGAGGEESGINSYSSYDLQTNMIYTMAYNLPDNYSLSPTGPVFSAVAGVAHNSTLYAIDASTGSVAWSINFPGFGGGVSSTNGIVFTSTGNSTYYALSALSGAVLWKYTPSLPTLEFWNWGPPSVVDGKVFEVYGGKSGGVLAFSPQPSTTTTSSKSSITMTVSYSVLGGGSPSAPIFHYVLNGVAKTLTLTTTATVVSVDAGTAWSVIPNPLTGSSSSQQWIATVPLSGTTTTTIIAFPFQHQYKLTMKASGPGTVSPSSGWQNAGAKVTITAKPNSGHKFNSWKGTATGSYTGTSASHTITMNAAITETATFA